MFAKKEIFKQFHLVLLKKEIKGKIIRKQNQHGNYKQSLIVYILYILFCCCFRFDITCHLTFWCVYILVYMHINMFIVLLCASDVACNILFSYIDKPKILPTIITEMPLSSIQFAVVAYYSTIHTIINNQVVMVML